ncbi:MAG: hypothetical protein Kow0090_18670 [Myxococcota bacterium]
MITITINDKRIEVEEGSTILSAARTAEIYIPSLCSHPSLGCSEGLKPAEFIYQGERKIINHKPGETMKGCGICLVSVRGSQELVKACSTEVKEGMIITTESDHIKEARRNNLVPILARHPHACLVCPQQEGCDRLQCSQDVAKEERCCSLFGRCEFQAVTNYIGIAPKTPRWLPTALPIVKNEPLFERNYNLCLGCLRCVRACDELRDVRALGFVFDEKGEIQVGTLAPNLKDSDCRFCTACVEVCPTGALMDKNVRAGREEEDILACVSACPANINIPGYLRLIAEGKPDEANAVIREKVPFPGVLGRVCIRPCESVCRRGEVSEPVAICALKRYAADNERGTWKSLQRVAELTGRKVAVVGAGPAGLTAAFYLRKLGYAVTVFESRPQAGGMLRYSIPDFRLPQSVVEKEIADILEVGVELKTGVALGKDFTIESLKGEGYEAVFLAVGAGLSKRIKFEGSELPGVLWGVDFLYDVKEKKGLKLKEKVVIIGGGNVAIDVALTAIRCGASDVTIVCLERRDEMPADEWEIEQALDEGVKIFPGWGPQRILSEEGEITGVELIGCSSVFDKEGNFAPSFDERRETLPAEQVILAVGQTADLGFVAPESGIAIKRGMIVVNGDTFESGMKGVFAGGDVAKAPGAIIHSIAAGRKAASAIDRFLGGRGDIDEVLFDSQPPSPKIGKKKGFGYLAREKEQALSVSERRNGFNEVALGFGAEQAAVEAARCLQCDLRLMIEKVVFPPEKLRKWNRKNVELAPEKEGVYRLFGADKKTLVIKGVMNLKKALLKALDENDKASWFEYEEDPLYTKRESELIQQYLQKHGEMPGGGESDLDDLF